jgi:hypothetical protein
VVFLDASDMLAQGCPAQLIRKFEELAVSKNRSILAGLESHCSDPRKCHKFQHMPIPTTEGSYLRSELQYLNGGFIMGRAEVCAKAWKEIGSRFLDTQLGWGIYADEHPDIVAMDWRQEVVVSNTAMEWEAEFDISVEHGVQHAVKPVAGAEAGAVHAHHHHTTGQIGTYNINTNTTAMSEVEMIRLTNTARHPVFLHILCHTCQADHKVGVGGPRVYAQISKVIQSQSNSTGGQGLC